MPDTLERIEKTLDTLRPYISSHRGQVEVVDFDESDGVLLLRLGGTCSGCSASSITLRQGIEARLRQLVPPVRQGGGALAWWPLPARRRSRPRSAASEIPGSTTISSPPA